LRMPSLRERRGDAVLLARHFISGFARQYGVAEKRLDEASLGALERYDWPGNVRELENLVHREFLCTDDETIALAAVLAMGQTQLTDGLRAQVQPSVPLPQAAHYYELDYRRARAAILAEFEKAYVGHALAQSGGNVSQAARRVGKERRAFGKLIRKHGIDRDRYRG